MVRRQKIREVRFPCGNCGALQTYNAGTDSLHCEYCGHDTAIPTDSLGEIREIPFKAALKDLEKTAPVTTRFSVQCENCAARFNFEENIHAGACPFCGTPVVISSADSRPILPRSLVPFRIKAEEAEKRFAEWLAGLWFAPGRLKKAGGDTRRVAGIYIPYWTYDSRTETTYTGERGDAYQVPQQVVVVENGRRVTRTRMVTRVRWTRVSGRVSRFFDDVLVGAGKTLPRIITDQLSPWHLEEQRPFNEAYLSGYRSELYEVRLDEGFDIALNIMDGVIRADIARDIGGDFQRIHHLDTRHHRITYKHILLPVYSSAFTFGGKTYRFVINGQTGKVRGERPYSPWKITFAVLTVAVVAAIVVWLRANLR